MPTLVRAVVAFAAALCATRALGAETPTPADWNVYYGDAVGSQLVCLYPSGPHGFDHWTAELDPTDRSRCREFLRADIVNRKIFLVAPDASPGGFQLGKADAYCLGPTPGYGACTSIFFVRSFSDSPNYRSLDMASVQRVIQDADLVSLLEMANRKAAVARELAKREAYRTAFSQATTAAAMRQFQATYAKDDPKQLIEKLEPRWISVETDTLQAAHSPSELTRFIAEYEFADRGGLVPEARARLAAAQSRERVVAATKRQTEEVDTLYREVAACKATVRAAQAMIAREREVAEASGVTSLTNLHTAGEQLVSCRTALPQLYIRYRSLGGRLPLDAIQMGRSATR